MQNMEKRVFRNTTKCNLIIMLTTTCFGQCLAIFRPWKMLFLSYLALYSFFLLYIFHDQSFFPLIHFSWPEDGQHWPTHIVVNIINKLHLVVFWRTHFSILRCVLNWFILEYSGGLLRYPPVIYKPGISLSNLKSVKFIPILYLLSIFISRFGSWLLSRFQMPFHCSWRTMFHVSWTYTLQYPCNPVVTPWNKQDTFAASFIRKRNER
jgi:hypothetical protein